MLSLHKRNFSIGHIRYFHGARHRGEVTGFLKYRGNFGLYEPQASRLGSGQQALHPVCIALNQRRVSFKN